MSLPRQIKIAPSILTANFGELAAEIRAVEAAGADLIHLDVMDGSFVPNISFGPIVVEAVRRVTELPLDVHMMVEEPIRYIADYVNAGANSLTVHVEACAHLHRTVQRITEMDCGVGVALNPATPIESIREILPFIDMVLVMSVNPGFGGQRFIETSTSKLRRVRRLCTEFNPTCDIQVDGGINPQTIVDVVRSGANVIVAGSAIFNSRQTPAEAMTVLHAAVAEAV
ncbi:MAG: ribulose-phosphate 3-epimerase [Caldilineaceae bacterium]|nr:ribulose-phosphate 3-epimerase [Caldilineaceae bacterium]